MARQSNRLIGNQLEREVAAKLSAHGYWVHLLTQSTVGQPADMIAVKNRRAYLIDAKQCRGHTFEARRIEDNQYMAMHSFQERGNGVGWFAIHFSSGPIYMVPLSTFTDRAHVSAQWCAEHAITIDEWVEVPAG